MVRVIDRIRVPLLTPLETAQHLDIPERTIHSWLSSKAAGKPLVHSVTPLRRGHPAVPFVALVEAYVLRSLRNLRVAPAKISAAAADIRREFGTEYGLANRRIATDGIDVFVHYVDTDEMARVGDQQTPIRMVINDFLRYISWDDSDDPLPVRLTLRRFDPAVAQVVIDPRFAWGSPIVEPVKVRVDDVLGMWRAGEPVDAIADDYGLNVAQVETIVRVAA